MAVLDIRKYGDPVLREKAVRIVEVTPELRQLAADMGETMYSAGGIGLAANQVGCLDRLVVVDVTDAEERKRSGKRPPPAKPNLEVYLNPEILDSAVEDESCTEGCLSIPGVEGDVFRPISIRLRWMTLEGAIREGTFEDLRARVLQHEIDHLDGVLYIDRISTVKRSLLRGKLEDIRRRGAAGESREDDE